MGLFHEDGKSTFAGGTVGQAMAKHRLTHGKPKKEEKGDKHAELSGHLQNAKESLDKAQATHDGTGAGTDNPEEESAETSGGGLMSALGGASDKEC